MEVYGGWKGPFNSYPVHRVCTEKFSVASGVLKERTIPQSSLGHRNLEVEAMYCISYWLEMSCGKAYVRVRMLFIL